MIYNRAADRDISREKHISLERERERGRGKREREERERERERERSDTFLIPHNFYNVFSTRQISILVLLPNLLLKKIYNKTLHKNPIFNYNIRGTLDLPSHHLSRNFLINLKLIFFQQKH